MCSHANLLNKKWACYISMYSFIHVPKSSGSCVNECLALDRNFVTDNTHRMKCTNTNNPIVVVRDPYDRFLSLYQYWKYGSERYVNPVYIHRSTCSILDFIHFIQTNQTNMLYGYNTWAVHYKCTADWLAGVHYKNIIILRYQPDMDPVIDALYEFIQLPKPAAIRKVNISVKEPIADEEVVRAFVRQHYKADYDLIANISAFPEQFKCVL